MFDKKPDPNSPSYRKPVMIGATAGLTERGQFPEYEEWVRKREAKALLAKEEKIT